MVMSWEEYKDAVSYYFIKCNISSAAGLEFQERKIPRRTRYELT